jgi:dimethylglycine dehydrogenase
MIPCWVGRLTYTGDLGYEIWTNAEYQVALYEVLRADGRELGLKLFGGRALGSLRLEKSFGSWAREYRPIYGPFEAGLDRFVDLAKNDFIGRDGALREKEKGPARRLVTFVVDDAGADVIGDEPVRLDGKVVGWVTSGGYAHYVGKSVALGYVPAGLAGAQGSFNIEILGDWRPARIAARPLFDPEGARMRG